MPTTVVPVDAVNVEKKFGGAEITTSVVPASSVQDESATVQQQSAEVTAEPSAATPASPAQEEVTAGNVSAAEVPAAEVAINNEVPEAQDAAPSKEQSEPSSESNEPSKADIEKISPAPETEDSVKELSPVVEVEEVKETSSAAPAEVSSDPSESSTVTGSEVTSAKSEVVTENKSEGGVTTGKYFFSVRHKKNLCDIISMNVNTITLEKKFKKN